MSFSSIGDLSVGLRLRYLNTTLKEKANRFGSEMVTGQSADIVKKSHGALDVLGSLKRSVKMLEAYQVAATEQATLGRGIQTSLQKLQNGVGDLGARLATNSVVPTTISIATNADAALNGFRTAVAALNTTMAGRSLFAGRAFGSAAVAPVAKILDTLQAEVAGATSAGQVETIVAKYFDDPEGGFATSAYLGTQGTDGPVQVSDTAATEFEVTAATPAIRNMLKGLATAALLTRGVLGSDKRAQADILNEAGKIILSATGGIIQLRARIGGRQERLDKIQAENVARKTGLQMEVNNLVSVDKFESATRLQGVQADLEALYLATSKLSRLSLTRFLR